ncbi:hypothetical protein HMPREF0863_00299 [Erysipelotrichaceae bacterium 5_2_54FAA]|nr:hypothetical protein HMPREF0863_00299 [Erysipelotrichaceae bacterium 5_2_54FAA]
MRETIFDEHAMRLLLASKGLTIEAWAKALNISKVTLYRKMSGESDFWRDEIQKTCEFVEEKSLNYIFFASRVT